MSAVRTKYPIALALAEMFVAQAKPYVDSSLIVGSVRRRICRVKDIEVLLVAKRLPDLFGNPGELATQSLLTQLTNDGLLLPVSRGPKNKRFQMPYHVHEKAGAVWAADGRQTITLELYFATRSSLGYISALRTGPHDFSRAMVTQVRKGGLLDNACFCQLGTVWALGTCDDPNEPAPLYLPTEEDFFELLACPLIEPEQREHWRQFNPSGMRRRR